MNITKVSYQRAFIIGAFLQEKIGFEAEIGTVPVEGNELLDAVGIYPQRAETPEEVVSRLRQLAESIHREKYPHYYQDGGGELITEQQKPPEQPSTIQSLEELIMAETVLRLPDGTGGLLGWKLMAEKNPDLKPIFDKRLKELQP